MNLKARLAPQALVELFDRAAAYRLNRVEPAPPRPRLGIQRRAGLGAAPRS